MAAPDPPPIAAASSPARAGEPAGLARALARIAAQPHAAPAERARALLECAIAATGAESAHLLGADGRVAALDHGIGIPPDRLETIFEPYVRLPEAKRRGIVGTGLGLPITRQLVQAMGGTVAARAVPGGSAFEVRLPLAE